jgi:hypothetical protein
LELIVVEAKLHILILVELKIILREHSLLLLAGVHLLELWLLLLEHLLLLEKILLELLLLSDILERHLSLWVEVGVHF